jgi:beta-galactosidase
MIRTLQIFATKENDKNASCMGFINLINNFKRMNRIIIGLLLVIIVGSSCNQNIKNCNGREVESFNKGWDFQLQNDDTNNWQKVNIPHDWSIHSSYDTIYGTDWQSGFLQAGVGWYKKEFTYKPIWKDKKIIIHFEGVYMNATVWINGHKLGSRPNGYLDFYYDLTSYLTPGKNIIKVKVDHSKPRSGRWYTGSGIYRNVWLYAVEPTHIDLWGTQFVASSVTTKGADIETNVTIVNDDNKDKKIKINCQLLNDQNKVVLVYRKEVQLKANEYETFQLKSAVKNPMLWSPEHPNLYQLETTLIEGDELIDNSTIQVGFRDLVFRGDSGFYLNGKNTLIKGVCMHHAAGPVGAAVPKDVLKRRLQILKDMGSNAIRTSHNPFGSEFYELCNEMGLMVMNEFTDGWEAEKAEHDYGLYWKEWWQADAKTFLKRDRNHPSVIMWSIGNEVKKPSRQTQQTLIDYFKYFDKTRPITQGGHDPTRGMKGAEIATLLDVKGFNGDGEEKNVFEEYHAKFPESPMIGTEVPHTYQTRGVYRTKTHWRRKDFPAMWEIKGGKAGNLKGMYHRLFPISDLTKKEVFTEEKSTDYYKNGEYYTIKSNASLKEKLYYQSSYDNASVRSSARKAWQRTEEFPYVMGQFRWTAFDYLGETNNWPSRFGNFGVIDICGFPKDHFYLYQSLWTDEPMVHILPHWTHPGKDGVEIPVVVYTNCNEVELFLNEKSLGTKHYVGEQLVWMVPYATGKIKAVARTDSEIVSTSHKTAGKAASIELIPNKVEAKANNNDVIHIETNLIDIKGTFQPYADNVISYTIDGPGKIIGVDNGDPLDISDYKTNTRKAFRGKCLLMVQTTDSKGQIRIKANSEGIHSDEVIIDVN